MPSRARRVLAGVARHEHDLCERVEGPNGANDVGPEHARHVVVEQDQVGPDQPDQLDAERGVGGDVHVVPLGSQQGRVGCRELGVVVDHDHGSSGSRAKLL